MVSDSTFHSTHNVPPTTPAFVETSVKQSCRTKMKRNRAIEGRIKTVVKLEHICRYIHLERERHGDQGSQMMRGYTIISAVCDLACHHRPRIRRGLASEPAAGRKLQSAGWEEERGSPHIQSAAVVGFRRDAFITYPKRRGELTATCHSIAIQRDDEWRHRRGYVAPKYTGGA